MSELNTSVPENVTLRQIIDAENPLQLKLVLEDMLRWIRLYFEDRQIKIDASRYLFVHGIRQSIGNVLRDAALEYIRQMNIANQQLSKDSKIPRPSERLIQHAINHEIDRAWYRFLIEKNSELRYQGNVQWDELTAFVRSCVGHANDLETHAVAHFIWQIKRKMRGLAVGNHLMLVFVGKQGTGKSTAVSKLISPIEAYRSDMAISALADERNFQSLEENFVIVSDEMHGCTKTDVEILKQVISGSTLTSRRLYTNIREKLLQKTTLIGTSNNSLDILVRDGTGMRRFFEIACSDQMDWERLNGIDYVQLWQSIDESNEHGYLGPIKDLLNVVQEEMRAKDQIETYCDESGANLGSRTMQASVAQLYVDYHEWAKQSGFNPVDKNFFCRRLRHLGFESWRNNHQRGYFVSDQFHWHNSQIV